VYGAIKNLKKHMNAEEKFTKSLQKLINLNGSDIHLREDRVAYLRHKKIVEPNVEVDVFSRAEMLELLRTFLAQEKLEFFSKNKSVDFSHVALGRRLRGNAFVERGKLCVTLRLIPVVKNIDELKLPVILKDIALREQGFFLISGSVGNGKSTTLASMVSLINNEKQKHIMTIEDPIEFFYEDSLSFIDQRDVGIDVPDFESALKNALREDADVLVVGEMRNIETIRMAVTSAQTGHLVFSTLHTNNASQAIERIIDVFPAGEQRQIRLELSVCLIGVFCQKLVPSIDGNLVPAYELMLNTPAVSHLVREGRVKDIDLTIENSLKDGHVSYNRSLSKLFLDGVISRETALTYSPDKDALVQLIGA
jgi:twitching motility protein PilT